MITYPHCTYISDWGSLNTSGSSISISELDYISKDGNAYSLPPSPTGNISEVLSWLDSQLQSYWVWRIEGEKIKITLSENQIQNVVYNRWWVETIKTFTQSDCVDLPAFTTYESNNSITEENVYEWANIELSMLGAIMVILTIIAIFRK